MRIKCFFPANYPLEEEGLREISATRMVQQTFQIADISEGSMLWVFALLSLSQPHHYHVVVHQSSFCRGERASPITLPISAGLAASSLVKMSSFHHRHGFCVYVAAVIHFFRRLALADPLRIFFWYASSAALIFGSRVLTP